MTTPTENPKRKSKAKKKANLFVVNPPQRSDTEKDFLGNCIDLADDAKNQEDILGYAVVIFYKNGAMNSRWQSPEGMPERAFPFVVQDILQDWMKDEEEFADE